MKNIIHIYRQGWGLILRSLSWIIALWLVLLPLEILEAHADKLSGLSVNIILFAFFLIYLPFAIYFAYQLLKDLNKTDHQFVPLIDRFKRKKATED